VGDRFRRRAAVGAERAYAAGHRRPGGVAAGSCRPDPASFDYLPKYGAIDIVPQMSGTYEELIPRAAKLEVAGQTIWVEAVQDLLARALAAERIRTMNRQACDPTSASLSAATLTQSHLLRRFDA
jgi:hypothetical protein